MKERERERKKSRVKIALVNKEKRKKKGKKNKIDAQITEWNAFCTGNDESEDNVKEDKNEKEKVLNISFTNDFSFLF